MAPPDPFPPAANPVPVDEADDIGPAELELVAPP